MKNLLLLICLLLLSLFPLSVSAIEYDFLGGRPANPDPNIPNSSSWFIYNLDKGESKEDSLFVINNFTEAATLLIYAHDSVRSSSGGFALKQFVEPKSELGSWIKFYPEDVPSRFSKLFSEKGSILKFCESELGSNYSTADKQLFNEWCAGKESVELSIPGRKQRELAFIISIPDDVDVGEHRGGILIQKKEAENVTSGALQGVTLTTRVGIRIYETVPGNIVRQLEIRDFAVNKLFNEFDPARFFGGAEKAESYNISTSIRNLGNVSVDFKETITITDELGGSAPVIITDRDFQAFRNDTFISNYEWQSPRFGSYSFVSSIEYTDSAGNKQTVASDKVSFVIAPLREVFTLLAIVAMAFVVRLIYLKQWERKYSGANWISYTVKNGETITSVARRFNVNWEVFAKTNRIKPPYTLIPGQRLKVPAPNTTVISSRNTAPAKTRPLREKVSIKYTRKRI